MVLCIISRIYLGINLIIKGEKMNKEKNVVYDDITNYGIAIIKESMYLIKGKKVMKLSALIIKEREVKHEKLSICTIQK